MKSKFLTKNTSLSLYMLIFSMNISATTWVVNSNSDTDVCDIENCTLRGAVTNSSTNDVIEILPNLQINIGNPIQINIPLTVKGTGSNIDDVILSDGEPRIFEITEMGKLILQNLSIQNVNTLGKKHGAIYINKGELIVSHSLFQNNYNYLHKPSDSYQEQGEGGAISNIGGRLIIDDVVFDDNKSNYGGAIYSVDGFLNINNSKFIDNKTYENIQSTQDKGGGAIQVKSINNESVVEISNTKFEYNYSLKYGGAVYLVGEQVSSVISGSNFSSNIAWRGGAIRALYGNHHLINNNYKYNYGTTEYHSVIYGDGGAIYLNKNELVTIEDSYFYANQSALGGAVYSEDTNLIIKNSTFSNNHTDAGSGSALALMYELQETRISNSTFERNYGNETIISVASKSIEIENSTILERDGFIYAYGVESVKFSQNIILNEDGNNSCEMINLSFEQVYALSLGYNIYEDSSCFGISPNPSDINVAGSSSPIIVGFAEDNGGPTPTIALFEHTANIAIDAIPPELCNVSTDQRGVERPQGLGCDIGSYEYKILDELNIERVTKLSHAFQNIEFNTLAPIVGEPVVIAGVVTTNGIDAGAIRLKNVTANNFSIKFQEFDKDRENGESTYEHNLTEQLSVLIVGTGIQTLKDGTVIETLKFTMGDNNFDGHNYGVYQDQTISFGRITDKTPIVICNVQTFNGNQAVMTEISEIDNFGFTLSLVEQEFNNYQSQSDTYQNLYGHQEEEVGCIAITLAQNPDKVTSQIVWADENIQSTLFGDEIHLQEDLSYDTEVHVRYTKTVNLLWLEDGNDIHMFGGIVGGSNFREPATLRQCVSGNRGCDILKGDI